MDDHAEADLLARYTTEMIARANDPVVVSMTVWQAWCVLSTIQLALRHPGHAGAAAEAAADIARGIQEQVATTPAMAEIAALGWDPAHDA